MAIKTLHPSAAGATTALNSSLRLRRAVDQDSLVALATALRSLA